jgi:hypothetical protein
MTTRQVFLASLLVAGTITSSTMAHFGMKAPAAEVAIMRQEDTVE